ncbi:MAG: NADH-quinone oxidoreductase subunit J [Deltaproteobacteria bacterium]|jgi:NADH-quinone oxidoreductase subunit J|nr:NADH-quinone oxidoreductase subunit J [Deltaproteobacteria bacterium]
MEQLINPILDTLLAAIFSPLAYLEDLISAYLPGQQIAALAAFALYVLVILGGGTAAVMSRNLVRAMLGLVLTFLGVAGMYMLLASPFLAFMQLLIYVGAVCVLIFFAIMLTKNTAEGEEARLPSPVVGLYGLLAAVVPLGVLAPLVIIHADKLPQVTYGATDTRLLGEGLITFDVVPFELISIILLVAMAGAVFLAWRRRPEAGNDQ